MSAIYTQTVDLQPVKLGDKWLGILSIGPVLINAAQPTEVLTKVRMHFVQPGFPTFELSSDAGDADRDAPITITDANTWEVVVPPVQDFLPAEGEWEWDMEFYAGAESSPLTLYEGVLTVDPDITKE